MSFMLTILSGLKIFAKQEVTDDITDRLHYQLTSGLLVAFSVLVSFKQFGGKPMECLIPAVTGNYEGVEQYAESYCFAQSTYYMNFSEQVHYGDKSYLESSRGVSYYQWVPFFLLIAAAFFQFPYMTWRVFANHSGIRIHDLVNEVKEPKNLQPSVRKETVENLSIHLGNALKFHRRLYKKGLMPHKFVRCLNLPYSACYVTCVYLFSKVLYLINISGQFLMLNQFLRTGNNYNWYGVGVMKDLMSGESWLDTGAFPRVTLCNFQTRSVGNVQNYTIQCVLMINMFNEKIFILLWFWYQILCVLTAISLCYWAFMVITPFCNRDNDELPIALPPPPIRPPKHLLGNQFSAASAGPTVRFRTQSSKTSGGSNPIPYPGGNKLAQQFQGTPWAHHFTGPPRQTDSAPLIPMAKLPAHRYPDPEEVIISPEHLKSGGPGSKAELEYNLRTQQAPWRWPGPGEKPTVPPKPTSPLPTSAPIASGEQSRLGSYRSAEDERRTPTRLRHDVQGAVTLDMVDRGESQKLL